MQENDASRLSSDGRKMLTGSNVILKYITVLKCVVPCHAMQSNENGSAFVFCVKIKQTSAKQNKGNVRIQDRFNVQEYRLNASKRHE